MTRSMVRIHSGPSHLYARVYMCRHGLAKTLDPSGFRDGFASRCNFLREPAGPGFGPQLGRKLGRLFWMLWHVESLRLSRSIRRSVGPLLPASFPASGRRLPSLNIASVRFPCWPRTIYRHDISGHSSTTGEECRRKINGILMQPAIDGAVQN